MVLKSYPAKSIYSDPEPVPYVAVVNGKAKVSGYSARLIGQLYAAGVPLADLEADYHLTPAEIFAAVSYYYDFKEHFDAEEEAADQRYRSALAHTTPAWAAATGVATPTPTMTVLKNPNPSKINYAPRKKK